MSGPGCPGSFAGRQPDGKRTSLVHHRRDFYHSAVVLYDGVGRCKSQSAPGHLGRKIGFEDARENLFGNPAPGVPDYDLDPAAQSRNARCRRIAEVAVPCQDRDNAGPLHRLIGIEHDILDHLRKLSLIRINGPELAADVEPAVRRGPAQGEPRRVLYHRSEDY